MKSNKEFFDQLSVKTVNLIMLFVMVLISIFSLATPIIFFVYGAIIVFLSIFGFKQFLFDIVGCLLITCLTGIQYSVNLGLLEGGVGNVLFYILPAISMVLGIINFFVIKNNYKVYVLRGENAEGDLKNNEQIL